MLVGAAADRRRDRARGARRRVFAVGLLRARRHLPARAVLDVPHARGRCGSAGFLGARRADRRRAARRRRPRAAGVRGLLPARLPARARCSPAARACAGMAIDDARRVLDRPGARARACCCATCRTAAGSSSTSSSGRSSATRGAYFGGRAVRHAQAGAARSRRTRPSRGCSIGIVDRRSLAVWFAGLYQDWLQRHRRAAARRRRRARRADRRPVRVASSSASRRPRTPGAIFGAHGGALDRLDAVLFSGRRRLLRLAGAAVASRRARRRPATAALAGSAGGAPAQDADPVPRLRGRAATVTARRRVFGAANVDARTGAVRRDRVILSWFGVTNFAMAIRGHVVLLDAWVARGRAFGLRPHHRPPSSRS